MAYSQSFKLRAVKAYLSDSNRDHFWENGRFSLEEIAREFGITGTTLGIWARKYKEEGEDGLLSVWENRKRKEEERLNKKGLIPPCPLSPRRREVVQLAIRHGSNNKRLGELMGISHQTVKNHWIAIRKAIAAHNGDCLSPYPDRNPVEIILYCLRQGWVDLY